MSKGLQPRRGHFGVGRFALPNIRVIRAMQIMQEKLVD